MVPKADQIFELGNSEFSPRLKVPLNKARDSFNESMPKRNNPSLRKLLASKTSTNAVDNKAAILFAVKLSQLPNSAQRQNEVPNSIRLIDAGRCDLVFPPGWPPPFPCQHPDQ